MSDAGVYTVMSFSLLDCWDCGSSADISPMVAIALVLGVVVGLVRYRLNT